ncbi:hypothetical protein HK101_002788, partial [Irineochytrium annulatum]
MDPDYPSPVPAPVSGHRDETLPSFMDFMSYPSLVINHADQDLLQQYNGEGLDLDIDLGASSSYADTLGLSFLQPSYLDVPQHPPQQHREPFTAVDAHSFSDDLASFSGTFASSAASSDTIFTPEALALHTPYPFTHQVPLHDDGGMMMDTC